MTATIKQTTIRESTLTMPGIKIFVVDVENPEFLDTNVTKTPFEITSVKELKRETAMSILFRSWSRNWKILKRPSPYSTVMKKYKLEHIWLNLIT